MQIIGVQILAIIFALFMLYVTFLHYKRREITNGTFFFWTALWISLIALSLFPQILAPLIGQLKFVRILDLLMVLAFMVLTFVTFENQVKNRNLERKIEELTRKESLKELRSKK